MAYLHFHVFLVAHIQYLCLHSFDLVQKHGFVQDGYKENAAMDEKEIYL